MTQSTPRLIALCSPAMGSGKSEVARHLVEQHGFERIRFAAFLKAMMTALLKEIGYDDAMTARYVDGDLKETVIPELGCTSRHAQQTLGSEWGRKCIRDDLWAHLGQAKAKRLLRAGTSVVIDDMRFPNEVDKVEELGGDVRRIVRPEATVTSAHASEGQLDGYPMPEIFNTGTLQDLFTAADRSLFAP